jgi:hypothetical protein
MIDFLVFGSEWVDKESVGVEFADIGMVDIGFLVGDEIERLLIFFAMYWGLQLLKIIMKELCSFLYFIEKKEHWWKVSGKDM